MYKCNHCGNVFDSPAEAEREVDYYPRPFGNGCEPYGGGTYECCPCCGGEDFDRLEYDGENCPYCGEPIDFSNIEDENNFEYKCKECKVDIIVEDGDIDD